MIRVKPTSHTGRTVEIDTPHLRATIIDGKVVTWQPRDPDPPDHATINAHLATCQSCPHAGGVTTTKRGRDVYTIRCGSKRKGCGTVQLRHAGRCPEGKW